MSEIDLPLPDAIPSAAETTSAAVHPQLLMVLQAAVFMVSAEARVIAPLLPAIALGFQTSVAAAGMLITAYTIPYGLFQLVYGPPGRHAPCRDRRSSAMVGQSAAAPPQSLAR